MVQWIFTEGAILMTWKREFQKLGLFITLLSLEFSSAIRQKYLIM